MGSKLYEEALADVREMRKIAEAEAREQLAREFMPTIRQLVEKKIFGEDDEKDVDDDEDDDSVLLDKSADGLPVPSSLHAGPHGDRELKDSTACEQVEPAQKIESATAALEADYAVLVKQERIERASVDIYKQRAEEIYGSLQELKGLSGVPKTTKEIENRLERIYEGLNTLNSTEKEMLHEKDVHIKLTGLPDEVEVEGLAAAVEGAEDEPGDEMGDLDAPSDGDMDMESDMGSDMGDEDELDLESVVGEDDEEDEDEMNEELSLESLADDVVLEVDENDLRREVREMRNERKIQESLRAAKRPAAFRPPAPKRAPAEDPRVQKLARENSELSRKLKEYKSAVDGLRAKLEESALLSAKLAYANKLLQSESLSGKQKLAACERLDEACTVREAKLIYSSLAEASVPRKAQAPKVLGSASRPVRSGSDTLNESADSVNTDRWKVLAGLAGRDDQD